MPRRTIIAPAPAEPPGFSLLEVVLVLALLGIVGLLGSLGFVNFTRGFVIAKETTATTAKGQMAMLRMVKELNTVKDATLATSTRLAYTASRAGGDEAHELRLNGEQLLLDDEILVDRVSGFSLDYHDTYNGPAAGWSTNTRLIAINLTLAGADNIGANLNTRVALRNM